MDMETFFDARLVPPYAILSHRWSSNEISFQDFRHGREKDSAGYQKVAQFMACVRGLRSRFTTGSRPDWLWIDTCCIDKSSSTELSESICSMFRYYAEAKICIVYLDDVDAIPCGPQWCNKCQNCRRVMLQTHGSQWFTRGWTFQELMAAQTLIFVNKHWRIIGVLDKRAEGNTTATWHDTTMGLVSPWGFLSTLVRRTNIPRPTLTGERPLRATSIAQRLSWAARRKTTRIEDRAYSLLGLLGVEMPLLYGEGDRAWQRLQEEIIRTSNDETIFAWMPDRSTGQNSTMRNDDYHESRHGILAERIECFAHLGQLVKTPSFRREPYTITNQGLELRLRARHAVVGDTTLDPAQRLLLVPLNCSIDTYGWTPRKASNRPSTILILQRVSSCGHYDRLAYPEVRDIRKFAAARFGRAEAIDLRACENETIYVHTSSRMCSCDTSRVFRSDLPETPDIEALFGLMTDAKERAMTSAMQID